MIKVDYNTFINSPDSYIDKAAGNDGPLLIKREAKNAVIISEDAYNNLIENIYLIKEKANHDWLMESKDQLPK